MEKTLIYEGIEKTIQWVYVFAEELKSRGGNLEQLITELKKHIKSNAEINLIGFDEKFMGSALTKFSVTTHQENQVSPYQDVD